MTTTDRFLAKAKVMMRLKVEKSEKDTYLKKMLTSEFCFKLKSHRTKRIWFFQTFFCNTNPRTYLLRVCLTVGTARMNFPSSLGCGRDLNPRQSSCTDLVHFEARSTN